MTRVLRHLLPLLPLLCGIARLAGAESEIRRDDWSNLPRLRSKGPIQDLERQWWAFQPLYPGTPPRAAGTDVNPIDGWVRAGLESVQKSLSPAAEASILVRRMTLDLTGLPPTPEAIATFESACTSMGRDAAVAGLADRLLASPAYGERWARHWLDLVRYAESDGYRVDDGRPNAWRYRDWVVEAFNRDLPYDQFLQAQIAGDELWPDDPVRARVATGYLRHWIYEYNNRDARTQWQTILNDITDVTADVFLGVGLQCARCHDHKYDPLLQKDYYRLQAFFAPLIPRDDLTLSTPEEESVHANAMAEWKARSRSVLDAIEAIEAPIRARTSADAISRFPEDLQELIRRPRDQRSVLEHQIAELAWRQITYEWNRLPSHFKKADKAAIAPLREQLRPLEETRPDPLPRAMTVTDVGSEPPIVRMPRGDGEIVEPGPLSVLDPRPSKVDRRGLRPDTTGRRTTLARWLTDPVNPLPARVIVNRLWQQHFGTGLASSASDFGVLGERPSHPELLDWLAMELIRSGWSLKHVHRLIVTSATYGQAAARRRPDGTAPDTRRIEGYPLRRLDAEQLRDSLLAVSGELLNLRGGPSVDGSVPRRSVYTRVLRNQRDPLLGSFDSPEQFCSTARRNTTTTPTQALILMNSPFLEARASALADRVEREAGPQSEERIQHLYRRVLGRPPSEQEVERSREFLARQLMRIWGEAAPDGLEQPAERMALTDLCHALLNSNEFLYID